MYLVPKYQYRISSTIYMYVKSHNTRILHTTAAALAMTNTMIKQMKVLLEQEFIQQNWQSTKHWQNVSSNINGKYVWNYKTYRNKAGVKTREYTYLSRKDHGKERQKLPYICCIYNYSSTIRTCWHIQIVESNVSCIFTLHGPKMFRQ